MYAKMDKNQNPTLNGQNDKKQMGCWAKFKSFFDDRGFDLEYEYNATNQINILGENQNDIEGYRRISDRKSIGKRPVVESLDPLDGELTGVINFYEQFATLGDDTKEENTDIWRKSSQIRNRVSMRPSMLLTNIAEEKEGEDDIELNRSPPPAYIPTALIYAPPEPLELLCVFTERASRVCAAACAAAERAGGEARVVRGARETLEALRRDNDARLPHVIVVDARQPQLLDAPLLASAYLKDEFAVLPYLEAGFNRARAAAATTRAQIAATAALAAAADRCRDLVAITDDQQRILLTNKSWCRVLGWRVDEGPRPLTEAAGGEALRLATTGARDWEAPVTLRRRAAPDPMLLPCRGATIGLTRSYLWMFPFLSKTKKFTVIKRHCCSEEFPTAATESERGRGSLHSIRRGSLDVRSVASDGLRRTSLAKLQGLPLEAPITKVISLLSAATDGAPPSTVACIERAVDMLRTSELYSPQMRDDTKLRVEDPITTELIGALLSQGNTNVLSSRRSSNDSTVVRSQTNRTNIKHKTSGQLRELLDTALSWDFEIFRLEELTRDRPLAHLGLALMAGRFDVCAALECDERTLLHWLTVIETNYHSTNTYHNSTHAADVLQAVAYFLEKDRLKSVLEPLEAAAALVAAAAHDVDHPGTSSAFLCNSRHPLAVLYNDVSVLESHHAALTFKLTLSDDRVNIFKNLDRDTFKSVRHNVIDMILATEMTKHFEHLAKFVNVFYAKGSGSKEDGMHTDEPMSLDTTALSQPENVILIKRMMIKCADVSNASRPQKFAFEWARSLDPSRLASRVGFIDMQELVTHANNNHQRWKDLDDAGVTTIADVKRAQRQNTIQSPPTTSQPTAEE
ncbi:hypothetical protein O3G_MSEX010565 [Manduca sexta]|uniref:PDEase domain-containing protein n=1 Tax=Manduca sexta TaxID=7130 RepID=A0A921ZH36_MANSE|nr:hypothetical protein O3G_MSEX010565 [Manduca sexta]